MYMFRQICFVFIMVVMLAGCSIAPQQRTQPMPAGQITLAQQVKLLNDDGAIEEAGPVHKELFDKAWSSQDVVEAQVARIEKRPPKFQGA